MLGCPECRSVPREFSLWDILKAGPTQTYECHNCRQSFAGFDFIQDLDVRSRVIDPSIADKDLKRQLQELDGMRNMIATGKLRINSDETEDEDEDEDAFEVRAEDYFVNSDEAQASAVKKQLTSNFREMMRMLDLDPASEPGLSETPERVARFLQEFRQPCNLDKLLKSFAHYEKSNEMVILNDLQFGALCEHHFCPFFGKMHIGYIPNGNVVGLSKMQRLVSAAGRIRPSIQERLTNEIADTIERVLKPKGVIVVADHIVHTCMVVRGVSVQGVTTTTSAIRGVFRDVPHARTEFLSLIALR
jgi:GTP cyclohydrolase I